MTQREWLIARIQELRQKRPLSGDGYKALQEAIRELERDLATA